MAEILLGGRKKDEEGMVPLDEAARREFVSRRTFGDVEEGQQFRQLLRRLVSSQQGGGFSLASLMPKGGFRAPQVATVPVYSADPFGGGGVSGGYEIPYYETSDRWMVDPRYGTPPSMYETVNVPHPESPELSYAEQRLNQNYERWPGWIDLERLTPGKMQLGEQRWGPFNRPDYTQDVEAAINATGWTPTLQQMGLALGRMGDVHNRLYGPAYNPSDAERLNAFMLSLADAAGFDAGAWNAVTSRPEWAQYAEEARRIEGEREKAFKNYNKTSLKEILMHVIPAFAPVLGGLLGPSLFGAGEAAAAGSAAGGYFGLQATPSSLAAFDAGINLMNAAPTAAAAGGSLGLQATPSALAAFDSGINLMNAAPAAATGGSFGLKATPSALAAFDSGINLINAAPAAGAAMPNALGSGLQLPSSAVSAPDAGTGLGGGAGTGGSVFDVLKQAADILGKLPSPGVGMGKGVGVPPVGEGPSMGGPSLQDAQPEVQPEAQRGVKPGGGLGGAGQSTETFLTGPRGLTLDLLKLGRNVLLGA